MWCHCNSLGGKGTTAVLEWTGGISQTLTPLELKLIINQILIAKQVYKLLKSTWILHHDLSKLLLSSVKVMGNLKNIVTVQKITLKYSTTGLGSIELINLFSSPGEMGRLTETTEYSKYKGRGNPPYRYQLLETGVWRPYWWVLWRGELAACRGGHGVVWPE